MKRHGFAALRNSALAVGIAAAFTGAALGQTPTVCPAYVYMDFGKYVAYYAITRNSAAPFCGQPVSYSSTNATLSGNCQSGAGCVPANLLAPADRARKKRPHLNDPDTIADGIDPPTKADVQKGASLVNTGVNIVEFHKNPNGGVLLKAKVFVVQLEPDDVTPKPAVLEEFDAGVGHQVSAGTVDRSADEGEVITLSRDKRQVTILVNIQGNEWREYSIFLLKTEQR
jgi:hypothetical protein